MVVPSRLAMAGHARSKQDVDGRLPAFAGTSFAGHDVHSRHRKVDREAVSIMPGFIDR
jgi:hypothetical protein